MLGVTRERRRDREVILDLLVRQDRRAGRDPSDEGHDDAVELRL
jgi:hypothetical protein